MRGTFDQWQKFAPVLDKDLNKLKSAYFESKKPINDYIKKQESNVIAIKESLISKVDAIDGCLLYTSPSPRDRTRSRMPSSA